MAILALGYIGIGVSDVPAWRSFMGDILGTQVSDVADGGFTSRIDSRKWRIAVEPDSADDIIYAGWEVAGPAELEAVIARLSAAGVPVSRDAALAAQRGVMELARFVDPAGLTGEVYWGATERTEIPWVSPAGVSGFVAGAQGLGHIVIATREPGALHAFYADVLQFRLSDVIDYEVAPGIVIPVTFMHCNPRHHSFAFAPRAPDSDKKLIHFMLQVGRLDDVGFALDRCHTGGVDIAMTLGRHVNDQMLSFYAWTPSDFEVEYGWGAIDVDDAIWTVTRHDRISQWGHHRVPRTNKQKEGAA